MNMTASRVSLAVVAVIFVGATIFAILATWIWGWKLLLPAATDKATRINTVVAVSAYAAAMLGVIIALIAYWQASGRPSLGSEIKFPFLQSNLLVFESYKPPQIADWIGSADKGSVRMLQIKDADLIGTVVIKNSSRYAAQNPGLRIKFDGLYFNALSSGWTIAESWGDMRGAKAIQWDGGTENIIHGKWSRRLPDLDFNAVIVYRLNPPPRLVVTIVSDGCRPRTKNMLISLQKVAG
jgi:hypothetical protein